MMELFLTGNPLSWVQEEEYKFARAWVGAWKVHSSQKKEQEGSAGVCEMFEE